MSSNYQRPELKALTGARGIAAVLVFLGHFRLTIAQSFSLKEVMFFLSQIGYFVDFFFVLSGFIMAYVYQGRYETQNWTKVTKKFCYSRIIRIWPLHLTMILGLLSYASCKYLLLQTLGTQSPMSAFYNWSAWGFIMNILMLQGIDDSFAWNPPAWSISLEFFAYLCFPFLFTQKKLINNHKMLISLSVLILIFAGLIEYTDFPGTLFRCIGGFLLGACTAQFRNFTQLRVTPFYLSFFQTALLTSIVILISMDTYYLWIILSFSMLILLLSLEYGVVASAFASGPIHFLGKISFSIYLTHWPIMLVLGEVFNALNKIYPANSALLLLMETFIIPLMVIVISIGTYFLIETKLRIFLLAMRVNTSAKLLISK